MNKDDLVLCAGSAAFGAGVAMIVSGGPSFSSAFAISAAGSVIGIAAANGIAGVLCVDTGDPDDIVFIPADRNFTAVTITKKQAVAAPLLLTAGALATSFGLEALFSPSGNDVSKDAESATTWVIDDAQDVRTFTDLHETKAATLDDGTVLTLPNDVSTPVMDSAPAVR